MKNNISFQNNLTEEQKQELAQSFEDIEMLAPMRMSFLRTHGFLMDFNKPLPNFDAEMKVLKIIKDEYGRKRWWIRAKLIKKTNEYIAPKFIVLNPKDEKKKMKTVDFEIWNDDFAEKIESGQIKQDTKIKTNIKLHISVKDAYIADEQVELI
ncbi:hypothetical protein IBE33_09265 [Francisella philomiragia]|uniref:hypothetical protein n=1 Tax=Francisella philomiragia TaxID=28110 RepID=UPI001907425E|nr:hypothetical protein [Francisella philomiragia]MBK2341698.1 hypothetical protein [Francisella philomiragia]